MKGKRGERATATELRERFPAIASGIKRGWQSRVGCDDPDVCLPGFWLEVKTGKQPNPRAALKQAIEESARRIGAQTIVVGGPSCAVPVAVIRDDRKEPFAVLRWADLLDLIVKANPTWSEEPDAVIDGVAAMRRGQP